MANMRLVSEEGEEWRVDIGYSWSKVITKGRWTAFQKDNDNKISNGNTCRLKLIRVHSEDPNTPFDCNKLTTISLDCMLDILVCLTKMIGKCYICFL